MKNYKNHLLNLIKVFSSKEKKFSHFYFYEIEMAKRFYLQNEEQIKKDLTREEASLLNEFLTEYLKYQDSRMNLISFVNTAEYWNFLKNRNQKLGTEESNLYHDLSLSIQNVLNDSYIKDLEDFEVLMEEFAEESQENIRYINFFQQKLLLNSRLLKLFLFNIPKYFNSKFNYGIRLTLNHLLNADISENIYDYLFLIVIGSENPKRKQIVDEEFRNKFKNEISETINYLNVEASKKQKFIRLMENF